MDCSVLKNTESSKALWEPILLKHKFEMGRYQHRYWNHFPTPVTNISTVLQNLILVCPFIDQSKKCLPFLDHTCKASFTANSVAGATLYWCACEVKTVPGQPAQMAESRAASGAKTPQSAAPETLQKQGPNWRRLSPCPLICPSVEKKVHVPCIEMAVVPKCFLIKAGPRSESWIAAARVGKY